MKAKVGVGMARDIVHEVLKVRRVLRPRDLDRLGVPHAWVQHLGPDGTELDPTYLLSLRELDRVAHGLYVARGDRVDPLVLVLRKCSRLTVSLTSSLWLCGLLPERPEHDWFVMGAKDKVPSLKWPNTRFLRSRRPHEDRWTVDFERTRVDIHHPLRAVLECVRHRRRLGEAVVLEALRAALATPHVERGALLARAAQLHVLAPTRMLLARLEGTTGSNGEGQADASGGSTGSNRERAAVGS